MCRDSLEHARDRSAEPCRASELDEPRPVPDEPAVSKREAPALVARGLREWSEERARFLVVDREDGKLVVPIESDDDTRRPAAEASTRVVEQDRPAELAHPAKRYSAATSGVR
jgi:hypothetical protein